MRSNARSRCTTATRTTSRVPGVGSSARVEAQTQVRTAWGQASLAKLQGLGFSADLALYPGMAHSACPEEFADVTAFLAKALKSN